MKEGTLVLHVSHGKEMEVEYGKTEIIDRINSFFGYNCITNVILKIVQDKLIKKRKIFSKIKNSSEIDRKMKRIKDGQLKNSLKNFLEAYNERNK